jgi:hypothetical protein
MVIAPATVDRASAMAMALIMVRKLIVAVGTEIGTVVGTTGTNSGSVFSLETRLLLTSWRASPGAGLFSIALVSFLILIPIL